MKQVFFTLLLIASVLGFISCNSDNDKKAKNPFDTSTVSSNDQRNKIVVISDLHLGNDLTYSETVKHLKRLQDFLNEVRTSATVKELVIGGDMFDEWYIPTRADTYSGGSQADFVRKTVKANQNIFNVLNRIITDKKIKVTYIPGNHDMGFTATNIDIAMPGVNQARDSEPKSGIGTYSPVGYPEIAIEHGHRYDFFCAYAPGATETAAPNATFAPGYFFARIAANSFTDPTTPGAATKVPAVTLNNPTNAEQKSKYIYYSLWKQVLEGLIYVKDNFDDKIINANIGGYSKSYSVNDLLPKNGTDGSISINLYNNLFTQASWNDRLKYNNALVMTPIDSAIIGSLKTRFIDEQSNTQYFQVPSEVRYKRIVVFGHTHLPMIKTYNNKEGQKCIYANSGTWEDEKTRDKNAVIEQDSINMHFVVIAPNKQDQKKLTVALYQYRFGKHDLRDSQNIEL